MTGGGPLRDSLLSSTGYSIADDCLMLKQIRISEWWLARFLHLWSWCKMTWYVHNFLKGSGFHPSIEQNSRFVTLLLCYACKVTFYHVMILSLPSRIYFYPFPCMDYISQNSSVYQYTKMPGMVGILVWIPGLDEFPRRIKILQKGLCWTWPQKHFNTSQEKQLCITNPPPSPFTCCQ